MSPTSLNEISRQRLTAVLLAVTAAAFLFVFNSYALRIFPAKAFVFEPALMRPWTDGAGEGYAVEFTHSEGENVDNPRSDTMLTEDGRPLRWRLRNGLYNEKLGSGSWLHNPHAIVFTASDNSDPRTNGRRYVLQSPRFYTRAIGLWAALVFAAGVAGLYGLNFRRAPEASASAGGARSWSWQLPVAALLFLAGLYCNTGTLAPYADTHVAIASRSTGYLYSIDHAQHQALFAFVDGQPQEKWDHAVMLRRVLYPVLAWPLMKLTGFETGGILTGFLLNLAGFLAAAVLIRRQTGPRGGALALWLMALYPGAAYWAGLPYLHSLIFPSTLLLLFATDYLERAELRGVVRVSLLMGMLYLGYDLFAFFLPASLLLLAWRRRWGAAALSAVLQLLPLVVWTLWLTKVFHQPLVNENTVSYWQVIGAYLHVTDYTAWWAQASSAPHIGLDVFFGANFLFLPALFLFVAALNPVTSRVRLRPAETALLVTALVFFLCNNLAPSYESLWRMRGTWIARLYQPVFPVLIIFIARWWQHLPEGRPRLRVFASAAVGLALLGNALVIFGPILNNPGRISEQAFYRFYNHTDVHWIYGDYLRDFGRRPLGFPEPQSGK